jgi:hypothetical protein
MADFANVPSGYDEDPMVTASRPSDEPMFIQPFTTQLGYLLMRNWITYYRAPSSPSTASGW